MIDNNHYVGSVLLKSKHHTQLHEKPEINLELLPIVAAAQYCVFFLVQLLPGLDE